MENKVELVLLVSGKGSGFDETSEPMEEARARWESKVRLKTIQV
jgi:hypothetical protein